MHIDKYAADYRLENIEKNGKIKTVPVYKGKYYVFAEPYKANKQKPKFVLCAVCLSVLMGISLFMKISAMRNGFVTIPYFSGCFPCFFLCASILRLARAKDRLTRENHDKIYGRTAVCCFIGLFLSLAALIAATYSLFASGEINTYDVIFFLCILLCCMIYIYIFSNKEHIKTIEEQ